MKPAHLLSLLCLSAACSAAAPSEQTSTSTEGALTPTTATPRPALDRPHRQSATAGSGVNYFGGSVIANAKVYVVWWGDAKNMNAALTKPTGGIADFFKGVLDSPFMDSLSQYSTNINAQAGSKSGSKGTQQIIGRGNYAGTYTLSSIPSGNVSDDQIQSALKDGINSGALPAPDANTLYAIFFPSSVTITIPGPDGGTSCFLFGAYHDATGNALVTGGATAKDPIGYAVMPDCGYAIDEWTNVTSHELAEAITDMIPTPGSMPDYPQAWNSTDGSEVGDLCEGGSGKLTTGHGNFTVQEIWDNASNSCKLTHSQATDYTVQAGAEPVSLTAGTTGTITFTTQQVAGTKVPLTLAVSAPPGVTATLSATNVMAGDSVTVTLSTEAGKTIKDGQVVLQATGPTTMGTNVHSAAALVQVGQ
jgi:hypothetical protein